MLKHCQVIIVLMLIGLLSVSCYHRRQVGSMPHHEPDTTFAQTDSAQFNSVHHYGRNYNFVVSSDSLTLYSQQPEEITSGMSVDSFSVAHDKRIVVADIRILPLAGSDSVWLQVATQDSQFGWTHESYLLHHVVPDDPISQFISAFSNTHLLIFLTGVVLVVIAFLLRKLMRKDAKIVHFNDIDSLYPTLLCLLVAASASLYASIQMFAPATWQEFYFHPTLNPFSTPPILCLFISAVWVMIIVLGAAIDDIYSQLNAEEATLYLCGLGAVCAIDYIVFSLLTLYYVGYPLLVAYYVFAIHRYHKRFRRYRCGNCGAPLPQKHARCPKCGTWNE